MIIYLSLYLQNTLGYSPVQAGLRFLPLTLASFTVALLTGRLIGKVAMRVLLGVAMAAAAAGLASMAHLTATSSWLVLLPGFILAGIGLGITSTGLASAALSAVEPARAGMAAGLTNTLRQVGTATGVAVFGALYASRVTTATLHALTGLPAPPGAVHRLAAAVASGAGTRVAAVVPPAAAHRGHPRRPRRHGQRAQRRPARRGRIRRARRDSRFRLRTRPSQTAAAQPRPRRTGRAVSPGPAPGPATGRAETTPPWHRCNCSTAAPSRFRPPDIRPPRARVHGRAVRANRPVYKPLSARTWTWAPGTLIMRHMTRASW